MRTVQNSRRTARLARTGMGAVAILAAFLPSIAPAMAAASFTDPFAGLTPMMADELQAQRGGFSVDTPVGTMTFDIGVTVTTRVDTPVKSLELQTTVEFNDQGQISSAQNRSSRQSGGTASAPVSVSDTEVQFNLADSGTVIMHRIARDHVTLATSLTASGVTIAQSAVLDIAINDLTLIRTMQNRLMISGIGRQIGAMAVR